MSEIMEIDLSHLDVLVGVDMTAWKRPERLSEPRIWLRENGFVVRDVTPDFDHFVLKHMETHFLRDEPINQALDTAGDPLASAEMRALWSCLMLPVRVSLVTIQEGTPGANLEKVSAENPPVIIGVNQLFVTKKDDPEVPDFNTVLKSEKVKLCIGTFIETGEMVNVYERYGVDTYIDGGGMCVDPAWRGKGIGNLLVKARNILCKEMGIPLTKTVFSAIQSQKVALKGGFELLGERIYAEMKDEKGDLLFPNMHPDQKKIQVMARLVD
ncbi:uncharacterized protein LOC132192460 isoform X1 [Neocloeon triangulifer]|uniref:uncharacterized protein LOC132192460 isoform X1 n=1 Tax=Neocloeon triangulifer TaxID=2078957 RepID=UPI00286F7210|nr:uncharacterized protein LOC132192460 isoform X1 [Neocloeon triangulifer]